MGPDIQNVAEHNGKTVEEVIQIHTSEEYLIYMIGFIAGFPYLGGMSKEIATPRFKKPQGLNRRRFGGNCRRADRCLPG